MNTHEDQVWDEVVEAATPNAAEMAEAEAGLRELGDVGPMDGADVERLVARATASESKRPLGLVGATAGARRWRQPVVKAAAAVLLLMAVAASLFNSVKSKPRLYSGALNYVKAVELATEPGRSDEEYLLALGQIADHCVYAADAIRQLATQAVHPILATQARKISAELVTLLTNGPTAPSEAVDLRLVESVATALDKGLSLNLRQQALSHVGELVRSGVTAMLLSPVAGDDAKSDRRNWIQTLLEKLSL